MFDEQLEIERNGGITVKNIAINDKVDGNVLYYVSYDDDDRLSGRPV